MEDMLYTVTEAAKLLKTSKGTIYQLQKNGLIRFMKLGSLKVRRKELERFLETYEGYDVSDPEHIVPLN